MRILAFDLGSKTLGVAISDALGLIARPLGVYKIDTNNLSQALDYAKILVGEHQIQKIVLGLPKNMDGSIGFQGNYTLKFKQILEENLDIDVVLVDERLSTKMANQVMIKADLSRKKRKEKVDQLAATIILQSYLDSVPQK